MITKRLSKVALLTLTATVFVACGAEDKKTETKNKEVTEEQKAQTKAIGEVDWEKVGWKKDSENLAWKEDTSPVKLNYYVNFSWFSLDWKDETAKKITDKTGVNLELTKPVADDNQKLNMMISGNQLPDLLTLDKNDPALQAMIDADMLWSFEELMEEHAPEMKNILPKETLENYKSDDGKTYSLTTWIQGEEWQSAAKEHNQLVGTNQPVWSIRKDYYEEIGRPEIKNIADFIKAIEEIKKKHPEKMGFYPADGVMLNAGTSPGLGNYGTQFGIDGNVVDIDGKAEWAVRDQTYYDAVKALNTMYQKELITKAPFIDTKDIAKAKIDKGDVISYSWTISDAEKVPGDNPNTQYEILPPFETYENVRTGSGWLATVVPKSTKKPDRAIKFLEYMASVEGHADASWGTFGDTYEGDVVKGPHWNLVDGEPTMLPKYVEAKNADWGGVASQNGLGEYWFATNELLWNIAWWDSQNEDLKKHNDMFGSKVVYKPELDIPAPLPTSDEGKILQEAQSLLQQEFVKMVMADNFDKAYNKFIKDAEKLGIKKVETYWDKEYQNNLK